MPETLPIVELISQNVVDAINTVTTAAGRPMTLCAERRLPMGNAARDNLCIVDQGQPEDEPATSQLHKTWRQPYEVICYVVESEESDYPIDRRINLIRCEVERALRLDKTRGGYAINTIIQPAELYAPAPITGVSVHCQVLYRTLIDDPYRQ